MVGYMVGAARARIGLLAVAASQLLLAVTLLALIPVYADAVNSAALRRSVATADPAATAFASTFTIEPAMLKPTLQALADAVPISTSEATGSRRPPIPVPTLTVVQSPGYRLPDFVAVDSDRGVTTTLAVVAASSGLDPWARVVPDPLDGPSDAIPARLHAEAAARLGLERGDTMVLHPSTAAAEPVTVIVTELVPADAVDRADRRWIDQGLIRDGLVSGVSFDEIGPFVINADDLSAVAGPLVVRWRGHIDIDHLDQTNRRAVAHYARGVDDRLQSALNRTVPATTTDLPAVIDRAEQASRTASVVVAAIVAQLLVVALYGVWLTASLLARRRARDLQLLSGRGVGVAQVAIGFGLEALAVVGVTTAMAPAAAVAVVGAMNRLPVMVDSGLDLRPVMSGEAWVLAAAGGALGLVLLVAPVVLAGRRAVRASVGDSGAGRWRLLDSGADVAAALLAIGGLVLLTTRRSALAEEVSGRLGVDPILIVGPTLAIIAAALLLLRLIRSLRPALERVAPGARSLSTFLTVTGLARSPLRQAPVAILALLATATGSFALSLETTWRTSQLVQAEATVGSPTWLVDTGSSRPQPSGVVRVTPPTTGATLPRSLLADRYLSLPAVIEARPFTIDEASVGAEIGRVPAILSPLGPPFRTTTIDPGVEVSLATEAFPDTTTYEQPWISLLYTDRSGVIQRTEPFTLQPGPNRLEPEGSATAVLAVEVTAPAVYVPPIQEPGQELQSEDSIVPRVTHSIELTGAEWLDDNWIRTHQTERESAQEEARITSRALADAGRSGLAIRLDPGSTLNPGARTTARTTAAVDGVVLPADRLVAPAVVADGFLDATNLGVGDQATVRIQGRSVSIEIVGSVPWLPGLPQEPRAIQLDWGAFALARFVESGSTRAPDQWLLATDHQLSVAQEDELRATLLGPPFAAIDVIAPRDTARTLLADPTAAGVLGVLLVGLVAVVVLAVVGVAVQSVSAAAEREPEAAVLSALGAPTGVGAWAHLREQLPVMVPAAVIGAGVGLGVAALSAPALTLTRSGQPAVPRPDLIVPISVAVLVVAVLVLTVLASAWVAGRTARRSRRT